jgi:hypothetical protein
MAASTWGRRREPAAAGPPAPQLPPSCHPPVRCVSRWCTTCCRVASGGKLARRCWPSVSLNCTGGQRAAWTGTWARHTGSVGRGIMQPSREQLAGPAVPAEHLQKKVAGHGGCRHSAPRSRRLRGRRQHLPSGRCCCCGSGGRRCGPGLAAGGQQLQLERGAGTEAQRLRTGGWRGCGW